MVEEVGHGGESVLFLVVVGRYMSADSEDKISSIIVIDSEGKVLHEFGRV